MDIGDWLRSLGLGRYQAQFEENNIDAQVLPKLTIEDLKDLGVTAIGDRRKLLDAIAALAVPATPGLATIDEVGRLSPLMVVDATQKRRA